MLSSLRFSVILLIICGGFYPVLVTGIGQALFNYQANGSIIMGKDGKPIGSEHIAQAFDKDIYFQPRPSAAGPDGYDATQSGGSNLAPTNAKLISSVSDRVAAYRAKNGLAPNMPVPADAVTASGSGLDPDISPANAFLQVHRVATARNVPEQQVQAMVTQHIEGRTLGIFGEPRVNVLMLNLALDNMK
ncbi:MAG: K(+)-transporting ATPase subunit C [Dehalococcoidia bacterium]|jgi:K+-transporting ATPase ATPase C chain